MGYTTVFNYTNNAPANTAGLTVTINNNINDGMDNNLYQVYGNCFFYKGTDGEYHDYEGTNPDLKVTASIPDSNGYRYIFIGWHHKNWNYLTNGLGKLTYKNNYNIGKSKTSYSLSPHFSRVGIEYDVRLNANVPENTDSVLQVLHEAGTSGYDYNSSERYFTKTLTYDDKQDMVSPDVYSLKGYHLISRSNWYTEKTGGNTVSAPCNNTEAEYPDWAESYWNLTTEDGATIDLYARWEANTYKISYNLDGGTHGESHPDSAKYDTTVTISNPTKTGYIFAGWTITDYDESTSGHDTSRW